MLKYLLASPAALIDDAHDMTDKLGKISVGQDAIRRLNEINATVNQLRPRVDALDGLPTDSDELRPYVDDIEAIMQLSDDVSHVTLNSVY